MELCIVIFLYFFLQFSFKISSNVAFCELNTVYFPLVMKGVLTKGCCCFFFLEIESEVHKMVASY